MATASASHKPLPERTLWDHSTAASPNIRLATIAPKIAPVTCAAQ